MVRVSGILALARSSANGPEWTHEGPQNGPQFLMEFWGSLSILVHLLQPASRFWQPYSRFMRYLLRSKYSLSGEYADKFTQLGGFTVR